MSRANEGRAVQSFKRVRTARQSLNPDTGPCFTQPQCCPIKWGCMVVSLVRIRAPRPAFAGAILLALGGLVSGCADMGDGLTSVFADPAKYALYDCKQLEAERKSLAVRAAELQGLMAKADTGVAGPVVAELAYRNDYISVRGQSRLVEEAWRRNKCQQTPPAATPAAATPAPPPADKHKHSHPRSDSAVN
jgi:hypothetical protein